MKKISLYLVCIMMVISLSCMEHIVVEFCLDDHSPLVQTLYNETHSFLGNERCDRHFIAPIQEKSKEIIQKNVELTNLIATLNSAKKNNITEDHMALFSYNILEGMNGNNNELRIPLFFSCLKRYNLIAKETKECLPDILLLRKNFFYQKLSQTVTITQPINIQPQQSINNCFSIKSLLKEYPTYLSLVDSITQLIHGPWSNIDIDKNFLTCLYTNKEVPFKDYYSDNYNNIIHDFYTQMYTIFHDKKINIDNPNTFLLHILDILRSMRHAKALKDITDEKQLGKEILSFELPQLRITSFLNYFRSHDINHSDINSIRNRISTFCLILKKYDSLCNNKQTPYLLQYFYYQIKNSLQLALPDDYANPAFDENVYAFKELGQLINAFQALVLADDESIEQLVHEHYYWG